MSVRNLLRSLLGLAFIALMGMLSPFFMDYGLDKAEPIGPFLNQNIPSSTPGGISGWKVVPAFPNLSFDDPLVFAAQPNGNQLYVGGRDGLIHSFENDPSVSEKSVFADLRDKVAVVWDGGFLGMAFHPSFGEANSPNNRYVYVYYTALTPGLPWGPTEFEGVGFPGTYYNTYLRLSRFEVDPENNVLDTDSEFMLINVRMYNGSHRGGGLLFDNDGFLYLSIGDQFRYWTAQDISSNFEGGVIRIDVDQRGGDISHAPIRKMGDGVGESDEFTGNGYYIPNDNPFLSPDGENFEEFWTLGHRNPHRMTYDAVDDRIWIGEVGEIDREEINVVEKGKNYEWPYMEGFNQREATPDQITGTARTPVVDFFRSEANAIIGGYVYRGSRHEALEGKYICGDYSQNRIFAISYDPATGQGEKEYLGQFTPGALGSFGQDQEGEIYFLGQGQEVNLYQLTPIGTNEEAPQLLSETGLFDDLASLTPAQGVIPYALNVPFWSDGAEKFRWIALPNDGEIDSPQEKITYSKNGEYDFPVGTVFIKHFELDLDETSAGGNKKLETRLMVHGEDGEYYGLTYKWRDDGSDAVLLETGQFESYEVLTANGLKSQTWQYPSRSECLTCHTQSAGNVLGFKSRQLNKEITYPQTGRTANQLATFNHIQAFDQNLAEEELPGLLTSAPSAQESLDLELRARSYLDANCSYCHRPGTGNRGAFDARLSTPLAAQNLIEGNVSNGMGIPGAKVIVPQDTGKSTVFQRMKTLHSGFAMPPLAKNVVDTAGVRLIGEWIMSLDPDSIPQLECNASGQILMEVWENIEGLSVRNIPVDESPSSTSLLDIFESPTDVADDYGLRIRGYICPPASGSYIFWLASDDNGELWLSTDDDPKNKQLIASVPEWTASREWDKFPSQQSEALLLIEGQRYYIEALAKEGGGADNLAVGWLRADGIMERPIAGEHLSPWTDNGKLPQTISVFEVPNKLTTDPDFEINAKASSGLEVDLEFVSGPAELNDNKISLFGSPGNVIIRASQAGNEAYNAAPDVEINILVSEPGTIGNGLTAMYYDNIDFTGPRILKTDPKIDFDWGVGAPDPSMGVDDFSVRWEGFVKAPVSGNYTFFTSTDDGVRLWVDNNQLVNQWIDQGTTTYSGGLFLEGGKLTPIKMEYYERGGGAVARLEWSSAGIERTIIPQTNLFALTSQIGQSITLKSVPPQRVVNEPFLLEGEASSGLPINYSLISGPARINNGIVSLTGERGIVNIQASQNGNENYYPAPSQKLSFVVTDGNSNEFKPVQSTPEGGLPCYTLTEETSFNTSGAAWYEEPVYLDRPLRMTLGVYLGSNDDGADGMSLVFQNSLDGKNALGPLGGDLGAATLVPSFGIEIDTWANIDEGDIFDDHIAFWKDGVVLGGTLQEAVCAKPECQNIEDGLYHEIEIRWTPTNNFMQVWFDGDFRTTIQEDLLNNVFGGNPEVWMGMTAGTGGATNKQGFCLINIENTDPTPLDPELSSAFNIQYYPNPFTHTIKLTIDKDSNEPSLIQLFDLQGRTVHISRYLPAQQPTPIGAELPSGIYILRVQSGDIVKEMKLVKQ